MSNVEPLARAWLDAKTAEQRANAVRIKIEEQLCQAVHVPEEGSKTQKFGTFKITATQPVTRKIDAAIWEKVKDRIPQNLHPVKTVIEADGTGCKYLADNEPEIWRQIAEAFTVKPGKVGFKVEEIG